MGHPVSIHKVGHPVSIHKVGHPVSIHKVGHPVSIHKVQDGKKLICWFITTQLYECGNVCLKFM